MKDKQLAQRLGQIKNLIMLASADGHIADEELMVIAQVAMREKLSDEELNKVIEHPDDIHIEVPTDDEQRHQYLTDMVTLMMIDGELDEQEMSICKVYAMHIGYPSTKVDEIVNDIITEVETSAAE